MLFLLTVSVYAATARPSTQILTYFPNAYFVLVDVTVQQQQVALPVSHICSEI
jgi:hypothetical protein